MATSLAQQLKSLRTPQTSLVYEKKKASILFTEPEAASYDRDVYYDIGQAGFQDLLEINNEFRKFKDPLFGKAARDLQRAVETKEVNQKLDDAIEGFLLLLSPYLEKQASLKALEWLIHRFMINEMNIPALLMCIFPYYESALFIRILQIIPLSDHWLFLVGPKKKGFPVAKHTVFMEWGKNQGFRSFLAKYLKKMCTVHNKEANLKIAIAFYTSTVIGGLCLQEVVQEWHISYIIKSLPTCLKSPHTELVAGMYFILVQLSIKVKLNQDLLDRVMELMISENNPPTALKRECMLTLLVIFHHQEMTNLSPALVERLDEKPELLQQVEEQAKIKSVAPFMSAYVAAYIKWLCNEACELKTPVKQKKFAHLLQLIGRMPLSSSDAAEVIWSVFEAVEDNYDHIKEMATMNLGSAINQLEVNHTEGYSQAMAKLISWNDMHVGKKYKLILKKVLNTQDGGSGISFTHLVHPDDKVRLAAAENFAEKVNKGLENDEKMIKMQMTNMLNDEYPAIVSVALSLENGIHMLETSFAMEKCEELLERVQSHHEKWGDIQIPCLRVLCQTLSPKFDKDQLMNVLFICLPYVLFPKSHDYAAAKMILKSKMTVCSPFLAALAMELSPLLMNLKQKQYLRKIMTVVPKAISELSKEEQVALWSYVEKYLASQHSQLGCFVSLVLLRCGLVSDKMEDDIRLKLAHKIVDACQAGLDSDIKAPSDKTKDMEGKNDHVELAFCLEAARKGSLTLPFLTCCLKQALQVFKLPAACTTTTFWTPFMEDVEEGNILLLIKALRSAIQLERFEDIGTAFRDNLVVVILKDSLKTIENRYYFLAMIWGWHSSLSELVDETLQVWSLKLGSSLLKSQSASLAWALSTTQPLVPSLLSALTNASKLVRCEAMGCVKELTKIVGGGLSQDNHNLLLKTLLKHDEELIADESHCSLILSEFGDKPSSKGLQIIQGLLEVVTSEHISLHLKVPIQYILIGITNTSVLLNLLPLANSIFVKIASLKPDAKLDVPSSLSLYYILLCFTPTTSGVLETEAGWDVFIKAINCSATVLNLHKEIVSPQSILMDQVMSRKFFTSIATEEVQARLWSILISRVAESENPYEAAQLRKGLRKVSLDAGVIITKIESLQLSTKATSIRAAQAKRIKQKVQKDQENNLLSWKKLGLMLETIGVMASLGRPWLLVGPLCQCLHQTFTKDLVITEIVQQQLLSALLHLLQKSMAEKGEDISKDVQLNVELIVQCIRSSASPDTHRRAMLVLAVAAKIFPDVVMHNMMSIFTFMGTSLLRRDDSYSFQVIHQTIQSIVPTLIKCEKKEKIEVKLAQVCQVFVDALPDLPEHRRLPLFSQLATTIDVEQNLWLLVALMCDIHVIKGTANEASMPKDEEKKGVPQNVQFALMLTSQFSGVTQVHACCKLMEYIINLPEEKEEEGTQEADDIINWKIHSTKQLCHFKYTCIGFMSHLLSSESFIGQVCDKPEGLDGELQELYQQLLEKTMCFLRTVNELCDTNKEKPSGKFWSSLQRKVISVLDGINAVLPPNMLLKVVDGLMKSPLPVVRCRAIELLCAKLQPNANFFRADNVEDLLPFMDALQKIGFPSDELVETRQTSLYGLQLLTKFLSAHVDARVLEPVLNLSIRMVCWGNVPDRIVTQALLVVAESVAALKAIVVPRLGRLLPAILKVLNENQEADYRLLAALTAIHKLVENVPQFLSPYLTPLVCCVCRLCALKEDPASKESRLQIRLAAVRDLLSDHIEPRIFIPCLTQAYEKLAENDIPAIQFLLAIAENLISRTDNKTLTVHMPVLLNLFSKTLEIRTQKGDSEVIIKVETSIISTMVRLLLRLNEHDNMAIFNSLQRWAVDSSDDEPTRLITFYRFADQLVGTLKVLFIKAKLADSLYSHAVAMLERNNSLNHHSTIFGSDEDAEKKSSDLISVILDTLTKVFMYDSVNFINQERFKMMVKPLIDQLENKHGGEEAYKDRVSNHLMPCVIKFTVATADDSLWKELNSEILKRVRNEDDTPVILAALTTFEGLADSLGEDYLQPLLADTMPYITEVLENVDDDVEEASRNVFSKMESILGDNLRAYLNE
ncbi:HEAT repeat-containing protein 1-like [Penaeus chinensis]|uniref:HEAT repeat-containing protein 1-like n=1 Tax=Penaeus chinensis TaxID=139456 RepID=UPI001FB73B89|nr:HEAT repeat-containing protein 1-like [Penaeus chinensis]